MNKLLLFLWAIILCVLNSCSNQEHLQRQARLAQWMEDNGKVKVLCTTAMIHDLVQAIGAEHVDAMTLIQGELDPHSYQLVKGDDEKLHFAQLIFFNGLELEHGPSLHRYLNENSKAIAIGDAIHRAYPGEVIEIGGQKDPHIWMDISLWWKAIPVITEALSQRDPAHAADFQENGRRLEKEMQNVHVQVREIMHKVSSDKRYLVTSHDAFHYFARAYLAEEGEKESGEWKKRFAAPEGLAPESQLSVKDIQGIIDHLQRYQIHLLFPESNVSKDSLRKIVEAGRAKGLKVELICCPLYGDAMGHPGSEGDSYLKMLLYNAHTLSHYMSGSGTNAQLQ